MTERPPASAPSGETAAEVADATRRTHLANERTQLAWWRTGMTAWAVALAVGRVVPELAGESGHWPYVVASIGFALWGVLAVAYGTIRQREVDRALAEGQFLHASGWAFAILKASALLLGLSVAIVILLG